ncbi:MAG: hypothetical protein U1E23_14820 [Reyranellaceae bacterium]
MPAVILPLALLLVGLATWLGQSDPVKLPRVCALVIPPPQATRATSLELAYRDGLPLAPGWLVILDHLGCD